MLSSAARMYLNHYGVAVGQNVGVYTACDSAWHAAIELQEAGVKIVAIIDMRANPDDQLLARAKALGIPVRTGSAVTKTSGKLRVKTMTVEPISDHLTEKFEIDALIMSGGWTPSVHLFSQSRGKLKFDEANGRFIPDIHVEQCASIGSCNGTNDIEEALSEAIAAANAATGKKAGKAPKTSGFASMQGHLIGSAKGAGPDDHVMAFVDYQNDVCAKDVRLAVREGMHSIEHVKRYTTTGMATDQGKMSNMHGLAIAAKCPWQGNPGCRPDHLPLALHAGHFRYHRQPCQGRFV